MYAYCQLELLQPHRTSSMFADASEAECLQKAILYFSWYVSDLVRKPPWSKHAEAVQADPPCAHTIASVLLTRCLPAAAMVAQPAALGQAAEDVQLAGLEMWTTQLACALAGSGVQEAAAAQLA